jgi:hypothetical protein
MKGDFTRDTFHPTSDFYRVLLQQGRVQLDADWNEQIAILLRRFELLIVDVFGPSWGPESACGFAVVGGEKGAFRSGSESPFRLTRGRYYVDGLLCENREILKLEPPALRDGEEAPKGYIVYLDVYEQYVAAAQDPALAEPALGGLDTAGRSRIRWTPKFWPISAARGDESPEHWKRECERALGEIADFEESRGRLKAGTSSPYGYTGAQNQLYRVEIHQGGTAAPDGNATWKWSRENGSVAFAVTSAESDDGSQIARLRGGPRAAGAFKPGDWVEIVRDTDREDDPAKCPLLKVTDADGSGASLTLAVNAPIAITGNPVARRWDQSTYDGTDLSASGGCMPLIEGEPLALEGGIEVTFSPAPGGRPHHYRGGDYWLIPARTAGATIEWPARAGEAEALPPHGVKHRFAPLAALAFRGGTLENVHDFRIRREPLAPS